MDLENITRLLHPGEQILWASMSNPGKLMDEENRMRNLRWFFAVGTVFALLMFLYVRACIHAGRSIVSVVSVVFFLMTLVIFLDPITTFQKLKKVEYAITTERVIVCPSRSSSFSLPLFKAAPVQVIEEDAVCTLIFGTDKAPKNARLRSLGILGLFITENDKDVRHPVFYRVPDAKEAVHILEVFGK